MIWRKTGVLSDKQIKKLLGRKIYIWPFKDNNLKGATYNLTASCIAVCDTDKGLKSLINDNNEIVIPPDKTALIQTEESIYVEKDICGTYHSKVSLVSKGLSHIGTTLDPCYFGTSLIAIHNHSNSNQEIKIGETFASLMLYKMPKSSKVRHDNPPFRYDIRNTSCKDFLLDIKPENKEKLTNEIEEWYSKGWRSNKEELIDVVSKHVKKRDERSVFKIIDIMTYILYIIIIAIIIFVALEKIPDDKASEYIGLLTIISGATLPLIQVVSVFVKDYLRGE